MRASLLEQLVDPISRSPLALEVREGNGEDDIHQGCLRAADGRSFPIVNGIPRFVLTEDDGQLQSADSFGFKWGQRQSYDRGEVRAQLANWQVKRYGFRDRADMTDYFRGRRRTLDAGCGSGLSSSIWLEHAGAPWIGADISQAIDVAQQRLGHCPHADFVQADVLQLPFPPGTFDTIFSEGVLHHTPSTETAIKSVAPLLEGGGEFLFYVYRKKAPMREFADDHIRETISGLPPAEAWEALRPLTQLGKTLAELHATIEIPEAIPCLGVKPGQYDLQRFVYWHFAKMFWNESFSFEENHHINFDWYHPRYAHRQTEEEVRRWCAEAGLRIRWFDAEESGFTVRAIKE